MFIFDGTIKVISLSTAQCFERLVQMHKLKPDLCYIRKASASILGLIYFFKKKKKTNRSMYCQYVESSSAVAVIVPSGGQFLQDAAW